MGARTDSVKISEKIVREYLKPWPILLPKGKYTMEFQTVKQISRRYFAFWPYYANRVPIDKAVSWIKQDDWLGKRHQIESLAKYGNLNHPMIIVSHNKVILDGNHRICALILKKRYKDLVLVFRHV